jgi:hypothetical protein
MCERAHQNIVVQDALDAGGVGENCVHIVDARAARPYGAFALGVGAERYSEFWSLRLGALQPNTDCVQNADLSLFHDLWLQILQSQFCAAFCKRPRQAHSSSPRLERGSARARIEYTAVCKCRHRVKAAQPSAEMTSHSRTCN